MKKLQLDCRETYEIVFVENVYNPNYTTVTIHLKDGNWIEIGKHNYKNKEKLDIYSEQILSTTINSIRY